MSITLSQIAVPLAIGVLLGGFIVIARKSGSPFLWIAAVAASIAYILFLVTKVLQLVLSIGQIGR